MSLDLLVDKKISFFGAKENKFNLGGYVYEAEGHKVREVTSGDEYVINTEIQKVEYLAGKELESFLEKFSN